MFSQLCWPSTFYGQMHGDSSLVTLWWSDSLQFALGFDLAHISPGLFCKQMWANLMLKRNMLHTKAIHNPYFVSYKSYNVSSLIPGFNSLTNSREGREEWEDPEFDWFKSWTRGPDFSCQALAEALKKNSTLKNLNLEDNNIGPEGAEAWCLVRMVRKRAYQGSRYRHSFESEVSEMMKEISCRICRVKFCWSPMLQDYHSHHIE